jgi:hypothetical protein
MVVVFQGDPVHDCPMGLFQLDSVEGVIDDDV